MVFWLALPVHSGLLKRIDYPNLICLSHPHSFECFQCSNALKGTHNYISISNRRCLLKKCTLSIHISGEKVQHLLMELGRKGAVVDVITA